mmetsp:Transcript_33877/g.84846  ORF Transcript_33877/g.84846 Transcript_33877/m.84846 type:complete len:125 (+) Transcript_33877:89-463(+)
MWTLRCLEAGGFVGSVRVREQHVRVRSVRDWAVCAHVVLWAAALCACTLIAWVPLGWAALVGMRDAGAWIGRAWSGGTTWRSAEHCAIWVPFVPQQSFSQRHTIPRAMECTAIAMRKASTHPRP